MKIDKYKKLVNSGTMKWLSFELATILTHNELYVLCLLVNEIQDKLSVEMLADEIQERCDDVTVDVLLGIKGLKTHRIIRRHSNGFKILLNREWYDAGFIKQEKEWISPKRAISFIPLINAVDVDKTAIVAFERFMAARKRYERKDVSFADLSITSGMLDYDLRARMASLVEARWCKVNKEGSYTLNIKAGLNTKYNKE